MRLIADLRYACRTLIHSPGFAAIAILSIALGVGLNAAMFSYVDAILLRPLPVPDSSRIVAVNSTAPGTRLGSMSYPDYVDLRDRTHTLTALACYQLVPVGVTVNPDSAAHMNLGAVVSGNFFSGLGIQIPVGRGFRPDEDVMAGRDLVVVISHALWESDFASDPGAVGRKIRVSGTDFTIIGVAPAGFTGPEAYVLPEVYVPIHDYAQAVPNSPGDSITARGNRGFYALRSLEIRLQCKSRAR
jgi:hypothetical protein